MEYLLIFVLLLAAVLKFDIYDGDALEKHRCFCFLAFMLFVLSAFRYRVGADTAAYMYEFDRLTPYKLDLGNLTEDVNRMPGWKLLVTFCKSISDNYFVYQIVHAFIVNFSILYFIRKYSKAIFVSMLLYFLLIYNVYNFDAMRESIAVSIFVWGLHFYFQKKWTKYYCVAFLSILFHISAIFVLLLPVLSVVKINKAILISFCALIIILIALFPFVNTFFLELSNIEQLGIIGDKAENYLSKDQYQANATPLSLLKASIYSVGIPLLLIVYYYRKSKNYSLIPFLMVFIILTILNIGAPIFYRFQNYIYIIYIIVISNVCYLLLREKKPVVVKQILVLFVICTFSYFPIKRMWIPSPVNSMVRVYSNYYPYQSIFSGKKDQKRESIYNSPDY